MASCIESSKVLTLLAPGNLRRIALSDMRLEVPSQSAPRLAF